jgi:hypothetical protein
VEDPQQRGFVGVQSDEQAVQGNKAGASPENTVEAGAQYRSASG